MTAGQFAAIVAIVLILLGVGGGIAYHVAQGRNQTNDRREHIECLVDVFQDEKSISDCS